LIYQFYRLFWDLVDFIFPPICGGCQEVGVRWCESCQRKTNIITAPICEICGQKNLHRICQRCKTHPPRFTAVRAWAEYDGPIRNAIHDMKYRKNIGLGNSLAMHLKDLFQGNQWSIDLVVPVPLGNEREKQRGYNQADLLARPLAFNLQIPYNPRTLMRVRETQSQVELSLVERQKNLRGAFQTQNRVEGKNIIVIDDVTTSGSTLEACASALLYAGANSVYGLTVARAMLKN